MHKNQRKWPRTIKNGQKWARVGKKYQEWARAGKIASDKARTGNNGQEQARVRSNGQEWARMEFIQRGCGMNCSPIKVLLSVTIVGKTPINSLKSSHLYLHATTNRSEPTLSHKPPTHLSSHSTH